MSDRTEGAGGDGGGGSAGGGGGIAHLPPQEDQQSLIESFRGITSSTPAEALFFLESHAWQLDAALQSFFDAADDDDYDTARSLPPAVAAAASQPAAPSGRPRRRRRQLQEEEEEGEDDEDYVPLAADESPRQRPATRLTAAAMASTSGSGKSSKPSGASSGRPAGGIRTLADLNRRSGPGSGSDSDDESDGPQEYYTGGEKSGMLVQDPSKGNTDVDAIFEQARQMGTTHESIDHLRSSSSKSFTGTGRLLTGETVEAAPEPPESVIHEVVFWTNGFTVNDGPLRRFDDPENAAFLESIKRSECPMELAPADRRTAVHVSLSRRDQKCPEPAKRFNPFGGVGRTLGAGSSTSSASPEAASAPASAAPAGSSSAAGLHVDDSLPSTSIQLRLADGTRMVARFNNHHTVGDIRGFIDASRPGATRSYLLYARSGLVVALHVHQRNGQGSIPAPGMMRFMKEFSRI